MIELTEVETNRLVQVRAMIRVLKSQVAFAEAINVRNSYINQIAGPNPRRAIGDRMAAKIETAFDLPSGSLDQPPPFKVEDFTLSEVVATLANASTFEKELVLSFAHWIIQRSIGSQQAGKSDKRIYDVGAICSDTKNKQNVSVVKTRQPKKLTNGVKQNVDPVRTARKKRGSD